MTLQELLTNISESTSVRITGEGLDKKDGLAKYWLSALPYDILLKEIEKISTTNVYEGVEQYPLIVIRIKQTEQDKFVSFIKSRIAYTLEYHEEELLKSVYGILSKSDKYKLEKLD